MFPPRKNEFHRKNSPRNHNSPTFLNENSPTRRFPSTSRQIRVNKLLACGVSERRFIIAKNLFPLFMKKLLLSLLFSAATVWAGPIVNIDRLGEQLGGWTDKGDRAATYQRSGSKYRTWKPEITPMLDGGLFISLRIDHLRGLFASDDHASLQVTLDKKGNIVSAQSSMAFQGNKITSDAIELGAKAGTTVMGVDEVAKIGTDLLTDLSAKLLRENVAEPGRVTFPAVIHHNYNILCLATGLLKEAPDPPKQKPAPPAQQPLDMPRDKDTTKKTGRPTPLPTGS